MSCKNKMLRQKTLLGILTIALFATLIIPCYAYDNSENFESGTQGDFTHTYEPYGYDYFSVGTEYVHGGSYSLKMNDTNSGRWSSVDGTANSYTYFTLDDSCSLWFYLDTSDGLNIFLQYGSYRKSCIWFINGDIEYGPATGLTDTGDNVNQTEWYILTIITEDISTGTWDFFVQNVAGEVITNQTDIAYENANMGACTARDLTIATTLAGTGVAYVDDINSPAEVYYGEEEEEEEEETNWWDEGNFGQIANYLVILAIIIIPAVVLGVWLKMGKWGILIGLVFGTGIGFLLYPALVPIWLLFLVAIAVIGYTLNEVRK